MNQLPGIAIGWRKLRVGEFIRPTDEVCFNGKSFELVETVRLYQTQNDGKYTIIRKLNEHAAALGKKGGSVKSPAKSAAAAANLAKNRNPGRKPKLQGLVEALEARIVTMRAIMAHQPDDIKTLPQLIADDLNAQQRISLEREKLGSAE